MDVNGNSSTMTSTRARLMWVGPCIFAAGNMFRVQVGDLLHIVNRDEYQLIKAQLSSIMSYEFYVELLSPAGKSYQERYTHRFHFRRIAGQQIMAA
jgi:hypothetical protein